MSHTVREAENEGWDGLKNGELLIAAEGAGFQVLVTTDKNIRYQQNLTDRTIAILVLGNPRWPVLQHHTHLVVDAVNAATPGSYAEVDIPE